MTCKDCIHYDLCRSCSRIQLGWHGNSVHYVENIEEICKDFKDRARFVELPCKVGDTVYVVENIAGEKKIIQDSVETIGIGYYADGIEIYQFDGIKTDGYFSDFGKTVFLTKEAAEEALKGCECNGQSEN